MGAFSNDKDLERKIRSFIPSAEAMPAVVIVQQLEPFESIYMNGNGLEGLGITLQELRKIGADYLRQFFNLDDAEDYLCRLKNMLDSRNTKESFTFLQQVKLKEKEDWVWHMDPPVFSFKMLRENPLTL